MSAARSLVHAIALFAAVSLCACSPPTPKHSSPIVHAAPQLKDVAAGDSIRISVVTSDSSLPKSTKVEITLEDAVQKLMQDAFITSAKTECQLKWSEHRASFEVPTTTDFRPGIWHVSKLRFFMPDKKTWTEMHEGKDFDGQPFLLTNTTKFVTDKPKLELVELTGVTEKQ